MRIEFEITSIPEGEKQKYTTAYLEGLLRIKFNDLTFFCQSEILLIEFAILIYRWLQRIKVDRYADFIFETMDNDEPILSLECVKEDLYRIESIWKERDFTELISKEDIINAFEKYLISLQKELLLKIGIELKGILLNNQE